MRNKCFDFFLLSFSKLSLTPANVRFDLSRSFSRETPTRFRKEIIKAAESAGHVKGSVEVDRINQLLTNIGRPERFSKDELDAILAEAGAAREQRAIPIDKMIQLM